MDHLWDDRGVAKVLQIDPTTFVRGIVKQGLISFVQVGRQRRYTDRDIQDYLDRQRVPAANGTTVGKP